ncbi:MAG TPA: TonB family protein [Candidatus Acidoferrales bacterium]|nr:TonB family protein [Candidatus Acidoferrales bacterium]
MRLAKIAVCLLALLPVSAVAQDQSSSQSAPAASAPSQNAAKTIRVGGSVMQAQLLKMVQPVYPDAVKEAHISGTVVLHATVGTDGKIEDLNVITGPPLLVQPAVEAVRQWEYKPVLLNGQAVRVDTAISVVFTLGGDSGEQAGQSSSAGQTPAAPNSLSTQDSQAGNSSSSGAIDPKFKSDLDQLLDVMKYQEKATAGMNAMIPAVRKQLETAFPSTPNKEKILDRFFEELLDLAKTDEFKSTIENVYAKYLTDDDVKAMIVFYKTPAGQHFNEFGSKIILESEQVGEAMGRAHALDIMKDLCKEYPELQGEAAFCPASTKKESSLVAPPGEITPAARP